MSAAPKTSGLQGSSAANPIEMCSVWVEGRLFGLPIMHILEIIGSSRPQPVPLAPPFIGGLVHYRGDVLTTVSLRYLLGLPATDRAQPILVLDSAGGSFGVLVDAVGEVLTVCPANHEPIPSNLDQQRKRLFKGAYKLPESLLVILDPACLDPLHMAAS
jgi:purine-binding chemotaxis protein CheW